MIKKLILMSTLCLFCMSAFASFPVNKKNVAKTINQVEQIQSVVIDAPATISAPVFVTDASAALSPAAASSGNDEMVILLLLWLFLAWPFAAHRWYAGKPAGWNILFILTLGGLGIWAIVDLINILTDNF